MSWILNEVLAIWRIVFLFRFLDRFYCLVEIALGLVAVVYALAVKFLVLCFRFFFGEFMGNLSCVIENGAVV